MPRKTRMFLRSLKSVGLVDVGANGQAEIELFKRGVPFERGGAYVAKAFAEKLPKLAAKMEEVARTYGEIAQTEEARREISDMIYRLQDSFVSIMNDKEADHASFMQRSLAEFVGAVMGKLATWSAQASEDAAKAGRKMNKQRLAAFKDATAALKDAMTKLTSILSEVDDPMMEEDEDMPDKDAKKQDDTAAKLAEVQKQLDAVTAERDALKAEAAKAAETAKAEQDPAKVEEDALKSLPESVRKRIEDTEKRLAEAEKRTAEETEKRELGEFVAKAAKINAPSTKPETFGAVLYRVAKNKATDEDRAEIERVAKVAAEMAEKAGIMREIGAAAGDDEEGSAKQRLDSIAMKIRTENPKITKAQAFLQACDQHPDLYRQARSEKTVH